DDTNVVKGQITSWGLSGGNKDVESVAAFGGFIDKEKPREQFELTLEVTPKIDTAESSLWDEYKYGVGLTSATEGTTKAIFVEANDGTNAKTWAFNNCYAVTWEPSHSADDNMSGSFTFKFSPTDDAGNANLVTVADEVTTVPAWS
ncbi:MAG: hypothetical protein B6V02_01520, partial [Thermoprotei archaeon ex4572_64]